MFQTTSCIEITHSWYKLLRRNTGNNPNLGDEKLLVHLVTKFLRVLALTRLISKDKIQYFL
ncbi:hypothetical protein Nos7524_1924 [Nostoc sp. PCC 7524]|nr:hypothetical protein Nos7524_1924 [Nostoc sp. PCC 7524]